MVETFIFETQKLCPCPKRGSMFQDTEDTPKTQSSHPKVYLTWALSLLVARGQRKPAPEELPRS